VARRRETVPPGYIGWIAQDEGDFWLTPLLVQHLGVHAITNEFTMAHNCYAHFAQGITLATGRQILLVNEGKRRRSVLSGMPRMPVFWTAATIEGGLGNLACSASAGGHYGRRLWVQVDHDEHATHGVSRASHNRMA
jgi:hypothetical protein